MRRTHVRRMAAHGGALIERLDAEPGGDAP
jgi:hypothetical protein